MTDKVSSLEHLLNSDPLLKPYAEVLNRRLDKIQRTEARLILGKTSLADFASGHTHFGLHFKDEQWVLREWAPNAQAVFLIGDLTGWQEKGAYAFKQLGSEGEWEIRLPADSLAHGDPYRLRVHWKGAAGDRIPAYARRVVQDPQTLIFNAQVWYPSVPFAWKHEGFSFLPDSLYIYEAHIGMAQEEEKIGTYREFAERVLPRIVRAGYNTLQLMAIQEHPYYASFGYQVSSFFAASSRFGTPEDLKALIDAAHAAGLRVIMDLIHSHAVSNETEGLSRFDGTTYQYFHAGQRGLHPAWDSRCFDYGKLQVLHFLLSNCRFWLDEYRLDGFRFDGVTSMVYHHRGLNKAFVSYDDYFDDSVDEDALIYLALANRLIHEIRSGAVTIAEDVSGMPGLATPAEKGGIGFDYRLAMGIPDFWIRLTKDITDEDWPTGHLWYELTNRRTDEKTISYAESHDQALVGDQTLIFRLIGSQMYEHMHVADDHLIVNRGLALHKMIRLITLATAGSGYLNFMGNEFGHPDWIDFPREGNNWSYRYARRQWPLLDNKNLRYHLLAHFDRDMIETAQRFRLLESSEIDLLHEHADHKIIVFQRCGLLFAFNFHPTRSFADYRLDAPPGEYQMILNTDDSTYGGHGRLAADQSHFTIPANSADDLRQILSLYLPTRTAIVLKQATRIIKGD